MRVPFIRRCVLLLDQKPPGAAFLVNINVLGTYVAHDVFPHLGEPVTIQFRVPPREQELSLEGVVAWVNPRQQHPVHSLPPGFGVSFRQLGDEQLKAIEGVVEDYVSRHSARR
jgi:Tfp pilus assembly protein PilZ